jgi:hypothetical protein
MSLTHVSFAPIKVARGWSRRWNRGCRHRANNVILSGHLCRTELRIGIGPDMCPFIWTTEVAFAYMFYALNESVTEAMALQYGRGMCAIFYQTLI